jgi:hypothetical protein
MIWLLLVMVACLGCSGFESSQISDWFAGVSLESWLHTGFLRREMNAVAIVA